MSRPQHIKGFYVVNRAWYAQAWQTPEVMIGLYHPDGGTTGEFAIRWHNLGRPDVISPRIEAYDDAWQVLALFVAAELGDLLRHSNNCRTIISQDWLIAFLKDRGFTDLTQYTAPGAKKLKSPARPALTAIAKKHLCIDELSDRNSDSGDFHTVSVWGVRDALEAAFEAGQKAGSK